MEHTLFRPELTLDEANVIISSPDGRRRRTSGNSDMSETEERPPPPAASLPVKKRIMEAIQEEKKQAARVPPTEVTPEDKKVSDVGNFEVRALATDVFVLKHESSIFRSFTKPCM